MKKLLCRIWVISLILTSIFSIRAAGSLPADEQARPEPAPGENRQQRDQETTSENFKIKVDVNLVTTDVTVIGAAAPELHEEDFTIYDNGIAQQVSHFSRDQIPLAVAVLIDGTESIRAFLPILQIAAISALRRLKPEDQVVLFSFYANPVRLSDLTEDRFLIAEKIGKLKIRTWTNIFDTIYDAARYLNKNAPRRRRAIILVSDNCHNAPSRYNADKDRVELLETATTLYNIRTPGDTPGYWGGSCLKADASIKQLADETGGEVLDVGAPTSLQAALEKAITNLRMQYTLGFNPSAPGENGRFHRLAVKLAAENRCPGCRLLARSGYYAEISAPSPPPNDVQTTPQRSAQKTDQLLVQQSILTAGTIDLDLSDIPFTVRTAEQTDSNGQPQLKVDLNIDLAGVGFKIVEGQRACRLRVTIFYADAKRKILGSDWRTIEGLLSEETYNRAIKAGISCTMTIPIKTQKQILKIVVYDEGSDRVGSKLVRLD